MKIPVAQVLIRYLKEIGTRYIFGVSGHSVFDITDALYGEPEIKYIPAQHELSAAYMADGYARGTRMLGVCLASSGAGATNLLTGIAQACKESSPVIALAADVSRRLGGKGASSWHEIPQEEIFKPITKMSLTLKRGEDILDVLNTVIREATTGRKGPVYLGIPRDLQREEVEVPSPPWAAPFSDANEIDSLLIKKAAEELSLAALPTIITGGGVYWSQGEEELKELAELLFAPFGTTPSHKGLISEDHPLSLGVLGTGAFSFANRVCLESDLILAVGTTFSEALTLGYGNRVIPKGVKII
ncbi:MAG: thiamine pyrophosphate-binding protein, partial [Deltaproteobacteria bacterium]|nr:thiamine pyrophosphate-binding protein [Deltaproteobacteria bacterium]